MNTDDRHGGRGCYTAEMKWLNEIKEEWLMMWAALEEMGLASGVRKYMADEYGRVDDE